jgi:hypothetical protein
MPSRKRDRVIGVNRIGLARGLGKKAQAAFLHKDLESGLHMADVFAVNHGHTFW